MNRFRRYVVLGVVTLSLLFGTTACEQPSMGGGNGSESAGQTPPALEQMDVAGEPLQVLASTNIVGDVVHNVAGDAADVSVLIPLGTDPHSYEPTPRDVATITDADVVFINGLGLEAALLSMLDTAGDDARIVALSEQVETIEFQGEAHTDEAHTDEAHTDAHEVDPHVWMNPNNVPIWTDVIAQTLSELDPANAETYASNAAAYRAELEELDVWIREQVAQVPEENRELVSDHAVFSHFAAAYGFEQIGTVVPGFSTVSDPSARQLAELQDTIEAYDVPAIFVGATVDPRLSEQIATDTGVEIRRVYTGSLSQPNGPAGTYVDFMRYNVSTIVDALKP